AQVLSGSKSQRWLVITKAICPWVSTAALGRPVVPDVKNSQQGLSLSTAALGTDAPKAPSISWATESARDGIALAPLSHSSSVSGCARLTAEATSGNSVWQRNTLGCVTSAI